MLAYYQLLLTIPSDSAEPIADLLMELGAFSVSLEDAEDTPLFQLTPDHTPLWEKVLLRALFDSSYSAESILTQIEKTFNIKEQLSFQIEPVTEQDWVRITQQNFPPQCYGNNLWICPSWVDEKNLSGTIIKLDPGVAFGTGTHPTTALCLEWLAEHPPIDRTVLDYGCGSGILALAAAKLGAKKVWAIDHDPQAVVATRDNAAKNQVHLEAKLDTEIPKNLRVQLILANILANPLIELAPRFAQWLEPGGHIVLSGILETEAQRVVDTFQTFFAIQESVAKEDWVRISARAPLI